jgi:uncharacterized protein YuzE
MATLATGDIKEYTSKYSAILHDFMKLPERSLWLDYDHDADVLYMSFRKPQRATKTIEVSEDVLVRKDGRKIVGMTIMNASTYKQ